MHTRAQILTANEMNFDNLHLEHLQFLEYILWAHTGHETQVYEYFFLSGGCINQAVKVHTNQGNFFVKWNESMSEDFFACEAQGLELLRQSGEVKVPEVIGYGCHNQKMYLILAYIDSRRSHAAYWTQLGVALAQLHTHTSPVFGLSYSNFIGSLTQTNTPNPNGIHFFIECRLKPQVGLAMYNQVMPGAVYDRFEELYKKLPALLPDQKPALLHGDLWHGNVLPDASGYACLIDPAVYYGNREAELAFTHLFGGFEPDFYKAYQSTFPLEAGFRERIDLYNLYPLLVHLNLFGSGYLSGIEKSLRKYLD